LHSHRGRMQAQGGGIEESEPWAQDAPLPARDAHDLLSRLAAKLNPAERRHREKAFEDAHGYVTGAATRGGADAPVKKSFPYPPRADHRRVDIEVRVGRAFVPDVGGGVRDG
jgi:hypothetical protein